MNRILLILCGGLLVGFYLFQKPIMEWLTPDQLEGYTAFSVKKVIRFIINDIMMIGVIYGLFGRVEYVKVAVVVQVFGLIFLLIPYLLLKYYLGGYNGPMISFLHRLVLNPLLMILLIPALYFHKKTYKT